jgi:NitT/TauT family transport system ATP-binding protein
MSLDQRQAAPPELVPGTPARSAFPAPGGPGLAGPAAIRISEVSKAFGRGRGTLLALDRVSLDVAPGEFVCLIGASGCGKSTLLSLVAGLDTPSAGVIESTGRRVALMFQEPALFPWLTAARNVELPLRAAGVASAERGWALGGGGREARGRERQGAGAGKADRRRRAADLLEMVHLGGFGDKRPHELSGGMRQRVALARALAQDADVLLMDEPFGALDAMTRDLLHDELDRICDDRELTVLFVTHNVREAVRLGDRVVVLSSRPGRVIDEFAVPIFAPRRIDSAPVAELASRITDRLREEMGRHGQAQ